MSVGRSHQQTQLTAWLLRRTGGSGIRRVAAIAAALATEVGDVRDENQDRIVVARGRDSLRRPFALIAVADGIGGMSMGAECAAVTLGSLVSAVADEALASGKPAEWLLRGFHHANNEVHSQLAGQGGSTLAAVLFTSSGSVHWASVGDSRIYRFDGSQLTQLSTDDTIAGQLGRGGDAAFEQSKLIQFVGIGESLEATVTTLDSPHSGCIFVSTDGVHFLDSTPWFGQLIRNAADPGNCVRRLVELSKWCGGPDNASAGMIVMGDSMDKGLSDIDRCLEIWDPFGELQLIVDAPLRKTPAPHVSSESKTAVAVEPQAKTDKRSANAAPARKRIRLSRQTKAKAKGSEAVEETSKNPPVPQLVMEFPNKPV